MVPYSIPLPSNEAALQEFNPYHDAKGRFTHAPGGMTRVGITSARPGKGNSEIFAQMRTFTGELRALPGVRRVKVSPGVGGYEGGAESTWVVSYRGNGEARKLLARTARAHNQDSILLMHRCKGRGCDPAVDFQFDQGVTGPERAAIHQTLVAEGIYGWTWLKRGGRTVLRAVSVPAWGGNTQAHLKAAQSVSRLLRETGHPHGLRVSPVKTEVIDRSKYDRVASGKG